ncbi:MAG: pyrroline-5-carboxylate reductase [Rhodothalassiaceae bacterium]
MLLTQCITSARPLLLVGCGRMGTALARAWLRQGLEARALHIVEPAGRPPIDEPFAHHAQIAEVPQDVRPRALVIAVKPQKITAVLEEVPRFAAAGPLLLSIAAGVTLKRLTAAVPSAVRAMPNTPAAIGQGITAAVAAPETHAEDRDLAAALMAATGDFLWLDDEALLDIVTAVSGSGPAYVYALTEAMAYAGKAQGLPMAIAERLARKTVIGAAALMAESGVPAAVLREQVTSPGGTTAAALEILRGEDGLEALMTKAVATATRRSRELDG